MSETTTESEISQWERVGGAPAVAAVLDRFYEGVIAEPQLAGFFDAVAVDDIKPHLAEVLKVVLGGPGARTDINLEEYLTGAHADLGVSASDYALTGEVLVETLSQFDVPEDIVATIVSALEAVAPFVISAAA
jgi:hemoglobin